MDCAALTVSIPPAGLDVISVQAAELLNYTTPEGPEVHVSVCDVKVAYQHQDEDDLTWVTVWLPLDNWNGRYMATGGGGLAAGHGPAALLEPALLGYAASSSDGGLTLNNTINPQTGAWALRDDNSTINVGLVQNFANRAVHDQAQLSKVLINTYYGTASNYSYYSGCSTGGRQGYISAQNYPEDFHGILANAPALNTPEISPADFWPSVVMKNIAAPPQCVFDAYMRAVMEYCDPLDGAADGLLSNLGSCDYDANRLVGLSVPCNDDDSADSGPANAVTVNITQAYADVVNKIWTGAVSRSGAPLFPGNPRGANFTGLANTTSDPATGITIPVPFSAAEAWIRFLVTQDPEYPTANMTFADFDDVFERSVARFSPHLGTLSPNLTQFAASGTRKILTWHGLADQLITPYSTMLYRSALAREMAATQEELNDFNRVFFAPGVAHCRGGVGPLPIDPLGALVRWVEEGVAPDTLAAAIVTGGKNLTRNLCPYPALITYDGQGDVDEAGSFSCP